MHELSIAISIIDQVLNIASENKSEAVKNVELEIGKISGVDIDSLEFVLNNIGKKNYQLKDCNYSFNIKEITKRCSECFCEYNVSDFSQSCTNCGSHLAQIIGGTELRILSITI